MTNLIYQFLDNHARCSPDSQAIAFLDESLTYAELVVASNHLARFLLSIGVKRGDRIGIFTNKCLQTSVALYGIMRAGAAYVPLDPSAPASRVASIIEDCDIRVLISDKNKKRVLRDIVGKVPSELYIIGVDTGIGLRARCATWSSVNTTASGPIPELSARSSDLAYIIYTSGTTGEPKGIMHTHQSCLSFSRWAKAEYQLDKSDRLSNHAPLHFDLSIFDYFAAVVAGACTVIIPEEHTMLPASYSQLLADQQVSVLFTVPFALIQLLLRGVLVQRNLEALRWVIFGGEPMPLKHLRNLMAQLPHAKFDNMYGPAEINGVSHYTVPVLIGEEESIPIGKISHIADALIVGEESQVVADGITGELLVRTPTMMSGYWRRPKLNEGAFHHRGDGAKLSTSYYRTGDLVVRDAEGMLWFRGRKDRQVKVRGYRVELDEVEAVLVAHQNVEEAATFITIGKDTQVEIYAAVRLAVNAVCSSVEIREYLRARLPRYAVPNGVSLRQEFPRTSTGKIDRRALSLEAVE